MWKKKDSEPEPPGLPQSPQMPSRPAARSAAGAAERKAIIGPSITVKGDIDGEGDILIEGRVEGGIRMRRHDVTVGRNGRVVADIRGKRICVEGQVKGDLFGEEVVIRGSGRVEGNASAGRVTLEQGCHFRGSINMEPEAEEVKEPQKKSPTAPRQVASGAA